MSPPSRLRFHSPEGLQLCQRLLKELAPDSDTHDWQLDVIARLLDQQDVLAITATGSGKTEMFIRLMRLVKVLSTLPSSKGDPRFPSDPAMIVICPTKALEEEMEARMRTAGLTAVAINGDRVSMAQNAGEPDLYKQVRTGVTVLLISPEQLVSPQFKATIDTPAFKSRVCMMAVDEAHLMNTWGSTFRKDYQETGWMRSRLPKNIPIIAVTATMQAGAPTRNVLALLGFQDNSYHVLRRSNMRYDFRIVFRTCRSGIRSTSFPELDWILTSPRRKILVFCRTIELGFRVNRYLYDHRALQDLSGDQRAKRIRMFNALNDPDYNSKTLALWRDNDPAVQVIVATSILSVGIDAPSFDDVIIFGEPDDVDEYWQELGRLRPRRSSSDTDGDSITSRGILYLTLRAQETAQKVLSTESHVGGTKKASPPIAMTRAMAELILAKCKVAALNTVYDNPLSDPLCPCTFCAQWPATLPPVKCTCSGCQPEVCEEVAVLEKGRRPDSSLKKTPKGRGISRAMRAAGTSHLHAWRISIFRQIDTKKYGYLPPSAFLPDAKIKLILDGIHGITSIEDLQLLTGDIPFLSNHIGDLFTQLQELVLLFQEMQVKQAEERRVRRTLKSKEKEASDENRSDGDSDISTEDISTIEHARLALRINLR